MRFPRALLLLWAVLLVGARLTGLVHEFEHDPLAGEDEVCERCLLGHGTGQALAGMPRLGIFPATAPVLVTELPGYRPGFSPLVRPPRAPPPALKSVWI